MQVEEISVTSDLYPSLHLGYVTEVESKETNISFDRNKHIPILYPVFNPGRPDDPFSFDKMRFISRDLVDINTMTLVSKPRSCSVTIEDYSKTFTNVVKEFITKPQPDVFVAMHWTDVFAEIKSLLNTYVSDIHIATLGVSIAAAPISLDTDTVLLSKEQYLNFEARKPILETILNNITVAISYQKMNVCNIGDFIEEVKKLVQGENHAQ